MTSDPNELFHVGLAAIAGGLGIASGMLLSGRLSFMMCGVLWGIGVITMAGAIGLIEHQDRRHRRDIELGWDALNRERQRLDRAYVRNGLVRVQEAAQ